MNGNNDNILNLVDDILEFSEFMRHMAASAGILDNYEVGRWHPFSSALVDEFPETANSPSEAPIGMLIVGDDKNDRLFTALSIVTRLARNEKCVFCNGSDLNELNCSCDIKSFFIELEKKLYGENDDEEENDPYLLFIEDPEHFKFSVKLYRHIFNGVAKCIYKGRRGESLSFLPVIVTENEGSVPSYLREILDVVKVKAPLLQQREAYLKECFTKYMDNDYDYPDELITIIAELTDGFSFVQLRDLAKNLSMYLMYFIKFERDKDKNIIFKADTKLRIASLVESQKQDVSFDNKFKTELLTVMDKIADKLEGLHEFSSAQRNTAQNNQIDSVKDLTKEQQALLGLDKDAFKKETQRQIDKTYHEPLGDIVEECHKYRDELLNEATE